MLKYCRFKKKNRGLIARTIDEQLDLIKGKMPKAQVYIFDISIVSNDNEYRRTLEAINNESIEYNGYGYKPILTGITSQISRYVPITTAGNNSILSEDGNQLKNIMKNIRQERERASNKFKELLKLTYQILFT